MTAEEKASLAQADISSERTFPRARRTTTKTKTSGPVEPPEPDSKISTEKHRDRKLSNLKRPEKIATRERQRRKRARTKGRREQLWQTETQRIRSSFLSAKAYWRCAVARILRIPLIAIVVRLRHPRCLVRKNERLSRWTNNKSRNHHLRNSFQPEFRTRGGGPAAR